MSDIYLIIDENSGRTLGYARTEYTSSASYETTVQTTQTDLASIFEQAKDEGETLDGADATMDDAIDEPLAFRDYVILEGETLAFDSEYVRDADSEA